MFRVVVVAALLAPLSSIVGCAGRDIHLRNGFSDPVAGGEGEGEGAAAEGEGEGEGATGGEGEGEGVGR